MVDFDFCCLVKSSLLKRTSYNPAVQISAYAVKLEICTAGVYEGILNIQILAKLGKVVSANILRQKETEK
jgi:hypothetical protein